VQRRSEEHQADGYRAGDQEDLGAQRDSATKPAPGAEERDERKRGENRGHYRDRSPGNDVAGVEIRVAGTSEAADGLLVEPREQQ
jgi:hypothetical protein